MPKPVPFPHRRMRRGQCVGKILAKRLLNHGGQRLTAFCPFARFTCRSRLPWIFFTYNKEEVHLLAVEFCEDDVPPAVAFEE